MVVLAGVSFLNFFPALFNVLTMMNTISAIINLVTIVLTNDIIMDEEYPWSLRFTLIYFNGKARILSLSKFKHSVDSSYTLLYSVYYKQLRKWSLK